MFYFDPLYLVVMGVGLILSLWATGKVKMNLAKYSKLAAASGLTGAQIAESWWKFFRDEGGRHFG